MSRARRTSTPARRCSSCWPIGRGCTSCGPSFTANTPSGTLPSTSGWRHRRCPSTSPSRGSPPPPAPDATLATTTHTLPGALPPVPLFIAFRLSRRPPTRRYTYGYRRAEDLAGVFVLAMITVSALVAGYEAVDRLIHPQSLTNVGWLFA